MNNRFTDSGYKENPNPLLKNVYDAEIRDSTYSQYSQEYTKTDDEKSNEFQAFNNIIKGAICAGILGLPFVVYESGVVFSIIIFIPMAYIAYYSALLLVQIADDLRKQDVTADDIYLTVLGPTYSNIYNFFTFFYQFGLLIAYTLFFQNLFSIGFLALGLKIPKIIFILLSLIIIVPMSVIRNFHRFQRYSLTGNIMMISVFMATYIYDFYRLFTIPFHHNNIVFGKTENLSSVLGVAILAFLYIQNTLFIRRSIKNPAKMQSIMQVGMGVIFGIYSTTCIITNFGLMDKPHEIFLFSFTKISPYFHLLNIIYAMSLVITFGVQFFAAIHILEQFQFIKQINQKESFFYKNSPRFCLVIIVMCVSYVAPKFHIVLSIVGSISGVIMQYVLPYIAFNKYFRSNLTKAKLFAHYLIMSIGVIGGLLSLYHTLKIVFRYYS